MASSGGTKVKLFRGSDTLSASGATVGGFITVANLMHEVVIRMVESGGFRVVFASENNSDLNTVSWGTLAMNASSTDLEWSKPAIPPQVGAPIIGQVLSDGPTASITLEATSMTNSLQREVPLTATLASLSTTTPATTTTTSKPTTSATTTTAAPLPPGVGLPLTSPLVNYPTEPWRVKFELLNSECVASYVATPLQLPGFYYDADLLSATPAPTMAADEWGVPGTHTRLVDPDGVPIDAAGAIGSQQIINYPGVTTTGKNAVQIISVAIDQAVAGSGYAPGDYLIEDQYFAHSGTGTGPTVGLYYYIGAGTPGSPLVPLPNRFRAIFRVESVVNTPAVGTTPAVVGAIKTLKIVVPGKYPVGTTIGGTVSLKNLTMGGVAASAGVGTGTPPTIKATVKLGTWCSGLDETDVYQGLYNRGNIVGANGASYPLLYELAVANSGFFLGIYESNWATQVGGSKVTLKTPATPPATIPTSTTTSGRFNWMVVQRPVDRNTGMILDDVLSKTSKHPVFCVNGIGGRYYQFVVREKDIAHPTAGPADHSKVAYYDVNSLPLGTLVSKYTTPSGAATNPWDDYKYRVPAVLNSEDNHLLFNPENQISLTEDKKYLVSFPHNISTPRFRYTEELDLIGLTSSDVLMAGQVITIKTYGELTDREYLALPPSGRYNTGLRICVVKSTKYGEPKANLI
jgi:hypothetical protein